MSAGRRVALVAHYPARDPAMPGLFISNHGMRMVEASLRAADLPGLELLALDLTDHALEPLLEQLEAFGPDVVGFSSYLWSFPTHFAAAERIARWRRKPTIVFGGPSARPSMFGLAPYRQAAEFVDALVTGDGEHAFREIVELRERTPEALGGVAGVAVPVLGAWKAGTTRGGADLNELPSPYRMGLVPPGGLGVLQTYRGCPFTCSFCEWGVLESPKRVLETANLEAELAAMDANHVAGALLVDAGLNLNPHAFKNLEAAALSSGFFEPRSLICEVYPANLAPAHHAFLQGVGRPLVGVGLQSFDNAVLANVERSYDEARFEANIRELAATANVAIEVIMGLPGDTPENFMRTFERARSFPCALRVYYCVVLPSALMVRAPAHFRLDYDPESLRMRSCLGWPADGLAATVQFLDDEAARTRGQAGQYFWVFPPPQVPA